MTLDPYGRVLTMVRWRSSTLAVVCTLVLVASTLSGQERRHPKPEYLVPNARDVTRLKLRRDAATPEMTHVVAELVRTTSRPANWGIGSLDGDALEVFGNLADIALDAHENVFVLDDRLISIRKFSAAGHYKANLGRAGRGPGEFTEPMAIALGRLNEVYVADAARRLLLFRPAGAGYRSTTIPLDFSPRDLCLLRGKLIVHGISLRTGSVLFAFDSANAVERTFGEIYRSPNNAINRELSQGKVACNDKVGVILFAPVTNLFELRAYQPDGKLRWISAVDGLTPIELAEVVGRAGSKLIRAPKEGFHRIHSAVAYPPNHFVVQIAFEAWADRPTRPEQRALYTLLIDARDGRGVFVGDSIPPIVAASDRAIIVMRNDPFPRLEVYRRNYAN